MIEVYEFQNGDNCRGVARVDTERGIEEDELLISGTYPAPETWAMNSESLLTVKDVKGMGAIVVRLIGGFERRLLAPGTVVEPGEWYRWHIDGEAEIAATFIPPFSPDQYTVQTESEIRSEEY